MMMTNQVIIARIFLTLFLYASQVSIDLGWSFKSSVSTVRSCRSSITGASMRRGPQKNVICKLAWLLQKCVACLVCLTKVVFEVRGYGCTTRDSCFVASRICSKQEIAFLSRFHLALSQWSFCYYRSGASIL